MDYLDHRPKAEHGRSDRGADDDLFRDRRIDHAVRPELIEKSVRHAIRAAEFTDVLADQVDGIVALHLFAKRFTKGDAVKLLFRH
jgi:hypothetical protein